MSTHVPDRLAVKTLLDAEGLERTLSRIAHEVIEQNDDLGRLALGRVRHGEVAKGQTVLWCHQDGTTSPVKVAELFVTEQLDRVPVERAGAGELVAIAGLPDVTIGETLADLDDPRPLPVITVPMKTSDLGGLDSLLSMVQMPTGVPVACVTINGARNAVILATQILGTGMPEYRAKIETMKREMAEG